MPINSKKNNKGNGNGKFNLTRKIKINNNKPDPNSVANINNSKIYNNSNVEENNEDKNLEQPVINLSEEEKENFEFLMNLTNVDLPVILDNINYEMEAKKIIMETKDKNESYELLGEDINEKLYKNIKEVTRDFERISNTLYDINESNESYENNENNESNESNESKKHTQVGGAFLTINQTKTIDHFSVNCKVLKTWLNANVKKSEDKKNIHYDQIIGICDIFISLFDTKRKFTDKFAIEDRQDLFMTEILKHYRTLNRDDKIFKLLELNFGKGSSDEDVEAIESKPYSSEQERENMIFWRQNKVTSIETFTKPRHQKFNIVNRNQLKQQKEIIIKSFILRFFVLIFKLNNYNFKQGKGKTLRNFKANFNVRDFFREKSSKELMFNEPEVKDNVNNLLETIPNFLKIIESGEENTELLVIFYCLFSINFHNSDSSLKFSFYKGSSYVSKECNLDELSELIDLTYNNLFNDIGGKSKRAVFVKKELVLPSQKNDLEEPVKIKEEFTSTKVEEVVCRFKDLDIVNNKLEPTPKQGKEPAVETITDEKYSFKTQDQIEGVIDLDKELGKMCDLMYTPSDVLERDPVSVIIGEWRKLNGKPFTIKEDRRIKLYDDGIGEEVNYKHFMSSWFKIENSIENPRDKKLKIALAWRGSDSIEDFTYGIKKIFYAPQYSLGLFERIIKFQFDYCNILVNKERIIDYVNKQHMIKLNPDYTEIELYFTGHSLGGFMALLSSWILKKYNSDDTIKINLVVFNPFFGNFCLKDIQYKRTKKVETNEQKTKEKIETILKYLGDLGGEGEIKRIYKVACREGTYLRSDIASDLFHNGDIFNKKEIQKKVEDYLDDEEIGSGRYTTYSKTAYKNIMRFNLIQIESLPIHFYRDNTLSNYNQLYLDTLNGEIIMGKRKTIASRITDSVKKMAAKLSGLEKNIVSLATQSHSMENFIGNNSLIGLGKSRLYFKHTDGSKYYIKGFDRKGDYGEKKCILTNYYTPPSSSQVIALPPPSSQVTRSLSKTPPQRIKINRSELSNNENSNNEPTQPPSSIFNKIIGKNKLKVAPAGGKKNKIRKTKKKYLKKIKKQRKSKKKKKN